MACALGTHTANRLEAWGQADTRHSGLFNSAAQGPGPGRISEVQEPCSGIRGRAYLWGHCSSEASLILAPSPGATGHPFPWTQVKVNRMDGAPS